VLLSRSMDLIMTWVPEQFLICEFGEMADDFMLVLFLLDELMAVLDGHLMLIVVFLDCLASGDILLESKLIHCHFLLMLALLGKLVPLPTLLSHPQLFPDAVYLLLQLHLFP
jgi:hypothetical protein